MVITEVACGINCPYSTALFNKYRLDCTAAEHTLGTAGFQGTQSETQKLRNLLCWQLSVAKGTNNANQKF